MSKSKFTKLLQDFSALARRNFFCRHVARFMLVLGIGLFVDYLSELARACQLLTTPYSFLFCPLAMYIYARHGGISLLIYAWSLPSLLVIVFAAVVVTLWTAIKSTTHT
jgi:hypothetical protein